MRERGNACSVREGRPAVTAAWKPTTSIRLKGSMIASHNHPGWIVSRQLRIPFEVPVLTDSARHLAERESGELESISSSSRDIVIIGFLPGGVQGLVKNLRGSGQPFERQTHQFLHVCRGSGEWAVGSGRSVNHKVLLQRQGSTSLIDTTTWFPEQSQLFLHCPLPIPHCPRSADSLRAACCRSHRATIPAH